MKTPRPTSSALHVQKAWIRWAVYGCFFLSGATSLIFEVLWSRQFVTVFGNSSYAISIVLCAYMAGLGLGGLIGGRLADRVSRHMLFYGAVQAVVALWALVIPLLLARLRILAPALSELSADSLLVSTLFRFTLSFAVLVIPCFLLGTTLPLLVRAVTMSDQSVGPRVGALYCWNTLGAAAGCLAAGYWMIETLGLRMTNLVAVGMNVAIALAAFALSRPTGRGSEPAPDAVRRDRQEKLEADDAPRVPAMLLLVVAFLNGLAGLATEVLWIRYLAFLDHGAYVFPTILCVYLAGLGLGGLIYALAARRIRAPVRALGIVEVLLAISILATFVVSALVFAAGPPRPMGLRGMALIVVLLPTALMGIAFPLLCTAYGRQVQVLGQRVGLLFAVNTAGTVCGSLLPIFVLVPWLGIQRSLMLAFLIYAGLGLALLAGAAGGRRRMLPRAAVACVGVLGLFLALVPGNLCQRVFLATDFELARHTEILFYREGRTGTALVTRDKVNQCQTVYINGVSEVPALYAHEICFKLLGDLGPLLHPNPEDVLMICFGGGLAAGATTQLPEVKSLTIVDLEDSVVAASSLLVEENNQLLQNPKTRVVIDDGRNYIMTSRRKWPVIISDSTHPKSGDSWVLYTKEFYESVCDHLAEDGIFVEWVPKHALSIGEFKIIVRTFQSVFPHASLWLCHGTDERGMFISYLMLVATPGPLRVDVDNLRARIGADPVRRDLEPYGLDSPAGFLDSFVCAEDALRRWVGEGPVNTDDLPYTQYDTRYSRGGLVDTPDFIEPREDLWPYLTNTGSEASARQLRDELILRAKVNRLACLHRWKEAYALLPEDTRYRHMNRLFDEAPQYLSALLKIYWDNPEALVILADRAGNGPANSIPTKPIFERVLELDPGNVSALNMVGSMCLEQGNLAVAEEHLRRAVRQAPTFVPARYNLALLLHRAGRSAEARREWQQAAETSSDPRAAERWAICLMQEGQVEDAQRWFNRAIEIRPTLVSARMNLAFLLARTGHGSEALAHVRYVLKLDPENQAILEVLARLEGQAPAAPKP